MSRPAGRRPLAGGLVSEILGIVGSGVISTGLAATALRDHRVILVARSAGSAQRAAAAIAKVCDKIGDARDPARVEITQDLARLADASFIIEATAEDMAVKTAVLQQIAGVAGPHAVVATTTSSLSVGSLSRSSGMAKRFLGLHVFNPVPRMELVELAFPEAVDAQSRRRAHALCAALGKTAIEVPDSKGFVVNRLLFPFLFHAVQLMEETGLQAEAIDRCMQLGAGHPMGPIALLDYIGLDVAEAIGGSMDIPVPARIRVLVRSGKLGRKTGSGLYGEPE